MSSSAEQFLSLQRHITRLFDIGHFIDSDQLEHDLDGLVVATRRMVNARRREDRPRFTTRLDIDRPRIQTPNMPRQASARSPPSRTNWSFTPRSPSTSPPPMRRMPQPLNLHMTVEEMNFINEYVNQATPEDLEFMNGVNEEYMRQQNARQSLPIRSHKKSAIGKERFNKTFQCAICLEDHINGESVTTECGHAYGKQCWETWMSNPTSNLCCPTCRKHHPKTTCYTLRADRKPKTQETV